MSLGITIGLHLNTIMQNGSTIFSISQEETKRSNYMRRLSFEILKMSYLNQSEFQI